MSVFAGETSDAGVVQVRGRRLRVRVARRGRHEAAHGARARAHRQERRRHHLQEDRRQQGPALPWQPSPPIIVFVVQGGSAVKLSITSLAVLAVILGKRGTRWSIKCC